jgi:hypothetical protein
MLKLLIALAIAAALYLFFSTIITKLKIRLARSLKYFINHRMRKPMG